MGSEQPTAGSIDIPNLASSMVEWLESRSDAERTCVLSLLMRGASEDTAGHGLPVMPMLGTPPAESPMDSLRLQMVLERREKMLWTLSNIFQRESQTGAAIIDNLR